MTKAMLKALAGFHNWVVRHLSGCQPRYILADHWEYPPIEEAFELTGLLPIDEYISERQNRLVDSIAT